MEVLVKLKRVALLILFARFNWRFESSFLSDEYGLPTAAETAQSSGEIPPNTVDIAKPFNKENRFTDALSNTLLSISPNTDFPWPYLETEAGRTCALRSRFPSQLFYCKAFAETTPSAIKQLENNEKQMSPEIPPFLTQVLSSSIESKDNQGLLANFRSCNGIYKKKPKLNSIMPKFKSKQLQEKEDALDIQNHQKILVLFCSFYCNPHAPTFCMQPYLLDMTFYGHNDIMLGEFLERYCFRNSYMCPSCNFPMLNHVRRYVHSRGSIQVKLTMIEPGTPTGKISIRSRCTKCDIYGPSSEMSKETWYLSFGKYLELRFHSHNYTINPNVPNEDGSSAEVCSHSLHRDYEQLFSSNGIETSFKYSAIKIWEIRLPFMILILRSNLNKKLLNSIAEEIKMFTPRGYEVYARIFEKLAQLSIDSECPLLEALIKTLKSDQGTYRAQIEAFHALNSDENSDNHQISDALFALKKLLADSIESWAHRFDDYFNQSQLDFKNNAAEPSADDKYGALQENGNQSASDKEQKSEKVDKTQERKKVKSIFREIFPADKTIHHCLLSPIPAAEHYCLPVGNIPVLVCDQDMSSIIAYSLVSVEYKKCLANIEETIAKKTYDSPNESDDKESEKEKKSKPSVYSEISFQDSSTQFNCRIYFPREFDSLRTYFLENGGNANQQRESQFSDAGEDFPNSHADGLRSLFARSLSKSVFWEARGGKSGSKFRKTLDDRFILKEMSIKELTLFENFAPQYFNYIKTCCQKNDLTLLAKLFGVYKVTVKKKDFTQEKHLLVMENLFYNCQISAKFDLKGSDRNRLVDPTVQSGELVLLDENLIQMSWSDPLYILNHSKLILREAIDRDASFLEKNDIMDYSLLVGQNSEEKLLILGIIDYIRTFTFDKKIESIVKQMGGQGKLPTIISPKQYRLRFSQAMDRYFLAVPDRWDGFNYR